MATGVASPQLLCFELSRRLVQAIPAKSLNLNEKKVVTGFRRRVIVANGRFESDMTVMERIQDFLGQKRFAIVGVSRSPKDFSRTLLREFRERGYDAVPVNPEVRVIDGRPCFARLHEIEPPVGAALLMTPPALTDKIVRECAEAGVKRVWMYRATGQGAVSAEAVKFCEANGISVIAGECPMMFLSGGAWFHRFHGWVKKIAGSYPR